MAKIGVSGIKEGKEEVGVTEPCFGGYLEEDPTCTECDEQEECQEKAKELLDGLSAVSEKNSEEEEVTKDAFDPKEVILLGEERIDVLCDLTKEQLLAVAEYNDIDVSHIDVRKKDTENDLVLEIDSQMAERESDEQYEEEEGDKSGTVADVDDKVEEKEDDTKVAEIVVEEKVEDSEESESEEEEIDLESEEISVSGDEGLGSSKDRQDEVRKVKSKGGIRDTGVRDIGERNIGLGVSRGILDLVRTQKLFLSGFGDAGLLKEVRNELNTIISDLLRGEEEEEEIAQVVVQEQVEVVSGKEVEPGKPEPELESIEKVVEHVVKGKKVTENALKEALHVSLPKEKVEGIPDCVIDLADKAGYTVKIKKTGFAVKDGGRNALTGVKTKGGVMIVFNGGIVDELEGSEAIAKPPWAPYPFVWADNPRLSFLIATHFEKE